NVSMVDPVCSSPFTYHVYKGLSPPFTGVAMKVTVSPGRISSRSASIKTSTTSNGTISISIITGTAHELSSGVKVYVNVPATLVAIVAGLQLPSIPLVEVVGNASGVASRQ